MTLRVLWTILPIWLLVLTGTFSTGSKAREVSLVPRAIDGASVYTGTAIGISRGGGQVYLPFTLKIDGQTTAQQAQQYTQILTTKGPAELLKVMGGSKLGTFSLQGSPAHDLNFVQVRPEQKGHSITALAEHWPGVFEVAGNTKIGDYPFTYLELFVNDNGKAAGTLVAAAKIDFRDGIADIVEFGAFPARLTDVQLSK